MLRVGRVVALIVTVGAIGAGGYALWSRTAKRPGAASATPGDHARAIDERYSPVIAMLKAPEGATPCESAYNAYRAFDEAPNPARFPRTWGSLPPKETFLARCGAQPREVQVCLQPRYHTRNRAECDEIVRRVFASNLVFDPMPRGEAPPQKGHPHPGSPGASAAHDAGPPPPDGHAAPR